MDPAGAALLLAEALNVNTDGTRVAVLRHPNLLRRPCSRWREAAAKLRLDVDDSGDWPIRSVGVKL